MVATSSGTEEHVDNDRVHLDYNIPPQDWDDEEDQMEEEEGEIAATFTTGGPPCLFIPDDISLEEIQNLNTRPRLDPFVAEKLYWKDTESWFRRPLPQIVKPVRAKYPRPEEFPSGVPRLKSDEWNKLSHQSKNLNEMLSLAETKVLYGSLPVFSKPTPPSARCVRKDNRWRLLTRLFALIFVMQ